jgi:hypothetical protein
LHPVRGVRRCAPFFLSIIIPLPKAWFLGMAKRISASTRAVGRRSGPAIGTGGKKHVQPRSLGNVFRAVRTYQLVRPFKTDTDGKTCREALKAAQCRAQTNSGIEITQQAMMQILKEEPSRYSLRQYKRPQQAVDGWEGPTGQPPFAVLHRYGQAADTFGAVLHLTSLFYAHFRDAGLNKEQAKENLAVITAIADGVIATAEQAKRDAETFKAVKKKYRFDEDAEADTNNGPLNRLRDDFINHLIDAFRHCPSVQTANFSVDPGHLPEEPAK